MFFCDDATENQEVPKIKKCILAALSLYNKLHHYILAQSNLLT